MFRNSRAAVLPLLCVTLAACGAVAEHKGHVIVGRDGRGALVALLGVCDAGVHVKMEISVYTPMPDPKGGPMAGGDVFPIGSAERDAATGGMLVELRKNRAPAGWSSDSWSLPDEGTFYVTVTTDREGTPVQVLDATVNLDEVPALPANARDLAVEGC